jgi:hypothetical protein
MLKPGSNEKNRKPNTPVHYEHKNALNKND